jgi:hypothetical protein
MLSNTVGIFILAFQQDGEMTTVHRVDKNVELSTVPKDLLDIIYIGRCDKRSQTCSRHAGDITDINIWNETLTTDQMIQWTNCK